MHLPARHGAMLDSIRHRKKAALTVGNRAVPKLNVERACEHKKENVGVIVLVLVERPLDRAWRS
jgi:hypothetical protein